MATGSSSGVGRQPAKDNDRGLRCPHRGAVSARRSAPGCRMPRSPAAGRASCAGVVDVDGEPDLLAAALAQGAQRAGDEVRAEAAAAPRRHHPDLVDPVVGDGHEADRLPRRVQRDPREVRAEVLVLRHLVTHSTRGGSGKPGRSAKDAEYAVWKAVADSSPKAMVRTPAGFLTRGMSLRSWRMTGSAKVCTRPCSRSSWSAVGLRCLDGDAHGGPVGAPGPPDELGTEAQAPEGRVHHAHRGHAAVGVEGQARCRHQLADLVAGADGRAGQHP